IVLAEFDGAHLPLLRPHGGACQGDEYHHSCPSHPSVSLKKRERESSASLDASFPSGFFYGLGSTGSLTVQVVPSPGLRVTSTSPPGAATMLLPMPNPTPSPPSPRLRALSTRKKRSNTCGRCSAEIPMPLSLVRTTANSSCRSTAPSTRPPAGVYLM